MKISLNHSSIYKFERKFNNHSGDWREDKAPKNFIELWKDVSLRLILKDKGGNRHYVYHFVYPYLRLETSSKMRGHQKKGEIEDWDTFAHLYWSFKEISCRVCLLFLVFFGAKKRMAFKSLFFFSFLDYWILLIYLAIAQNRGKIHTKVIVNVSRGGRVSEVVLPRRRANDLLWGRVCLEDQRIGGNYTE